MRTPDKATVDKGLGIIGRRHDALEWAIETQTVSAQPRSNLPPQVAALAMRLSPNAGACPSLQLHQTGNMWQALGSRPMAFTAIETVALTSVQFIWRASFPPFGLITVADYVTHDAAGLDVSLAGIVSISNTPDTAAMRRAEELRYLAELPWFPEAIWLNHHLHWRVINDQTLVVMTGDVPNRAEVTFHLNPAGQIDRVETGARMRQEGKLFTNRPWGGWFGDYQFCNGVLLPMRGEVHWVLNGQAFVYWSGVLTKRTACKLRR